MIFGIAGSALFGGFLVAIGTIILVVSGRYVWRATSIYRAEPVAMLGETAPGTLVRLSGTAQQGDTDLLRAPFSGSDCLVIRYAIEERRLSTYLLPWFVTIHELAASGTFRVRTAEGDIDILEPVHTVTLERTAVATVSPSDDPPERITRYERTTDAVPATTDWQAPPSLLRPLTRRLSMGARRYTEQRAMPGDDITVVGRVTKTGDGVDPLIISDCSPGQTVRRMAKTSLIGLCLGVGVVVVGLVAILV